MRTSSGARTRMTRPCSTTWSAAMLQFALDAVRDPVSGNIVCRATLPGAAFNAKAAGCSPLNLFGSNNASRAGLDYAFRKLVEYSTLKQQVLSANVGGELFDGFGAGAVKASFGAEARRDTADVTHDLANQPWYNDYFLSYGLDYAGKVSVLEGYGEVNVPVLKDAPLAKYLEFDAAIRETQNKNEGRDHRLRDQRGHGETRHLQLEAQLHLGSHRLVPLACDAFATCARRFPRAVRVPLRCRPAEPFGTITNPVNQQSQVITALTGGSINLEPEKADTTTVGMAFAPKWGALERFQFSADWYRIVLNDPISGPPFALGVQNIVEPLFSGSAGVLRSHYLSGRRATSAPSRRSTTRR